MSEEQKQTAQTLFEEGKKAFASGNYESSATQLGQACQLLDTLNGELAPENGDAYFTYGQALLQCAIQKNIVLGQSEQAPSAADSEASSSKAEKAESSNPLVQLSDMPTFQAPNEEDDEEEEDEEEEEGGAEDDFETAWDTLDISRIIFEKSDDKETRLKLADVHLCLGDVSLETEKFNEALTDYESAIQIKKELLAEDDRELAEAHYKYALALEFSTEKSDQAIPQLENAIAVLNKRIASLETCQKGKEKEGEGNNASKEIDEINELIPDMKLKIEELKVRQETEKQTKELLKTMFGLASDKTQDTLSKPVDENAVVNDLSTLVKRKAKETVKDDAASKKPKNE